METMERTVKKQKASIIMPCLLLLICAFFFVAYGMYVHEATLGQGATAGQVLYSLYAYGGFMVIALCGMTVASLFTKKKKAVITKVFIWGVILLAYHFASQFFANAFNLAVMKFQDGLTFSAEYIPCLLLSAAMIALLSQWNKENKRVTNTLAWISFLVAAFFAAWFIYYKLTSMISLDTVVIYDAVFGVAHALVVPFALAFLFCATRNAECFDQMFLH